jgi:hypothetical protein
MSGWGKLELLMQEQILKVAEACADEHPFVDTIEITNASLGLANDCL